MRGVLIGMYTHVPAVGVIGRSLPDIYRLEKTDSLDSLPMSKR